MLTKVILLCALFLIHPSSLLGQGSIDSAQISSLISQFSNADPNVRLTAFYGLLDLSLPFGISTTPYAVTDKTSKLLAVVPTPDVIRLALINLLSQEDRFVQTSNQHFAGDPVLSETYTDYYADLINSVATLHDPRSIPALVGAITSGGTAVGALAAFGNMSIRPTLLELTAPDEGARGFATLTLIGMLDPKNFVNLNAESILGLQRGLVKASGFSESYITVEAGKGLQQLDSKRI